MSKEEMEERIKELEREMLDLRQSIDVIRDDVRHVEKGLETLEAEA